MVNINAYNNNEMVLIKFCGNIFFWIFSVVDHKSVTDAGIIDSILAKPSLLKSNFCIRAQSKHVLHHVNNGQDSGLDVSLPRQDQGDIAIVQVHGSWFDPSNPIIKSRGNIRADLYQVGHYQSSLHLHTTFCLLIFV